MFEGDKVKNRKKLQWGSKLTGALNFWGFEPNPMVLSSSLGFQLVCNIGEA